MLQRFNAYNIVKVDLQALSMTWKCFTVLSTIAICRIPGVDSERVNQVAKVRIFKSNWIIIFDKHRNAFSTAKYIVKIYQHIPIYVQITKYSLPVASSVWNRGRHPVDIYGLIVVFAFSNLREDLILSSNFVLCYKCKHNTSKEICTPLGFCRVCCGHTVDTRYPPNKIALEER